jgi:hypothetical protein
LEFLNNITKDSPQRCHQNGDDDKDAGDDSCHLLLFIINNLIYSASENRDNLPRNAITKIYLSSKIT